MVLVILIALWAVVLVPPYLKDRRESTRTFRATQSGSLPTIRSSAQRFQPLVDARPAVRSNALAGPAVSPLGSPASLSQASRSSSGVPTRMAGGNVVQLHPVDDDIEILSGPMASEQVLQQAWDSSARSSRPGMPTSTAAARERRRHVLMGLTGAAFVSLMMAMAMRGGWIALHVAIDAVLVGYVILLVRFRQIASERVSKVAPIRPPVTEKAPTTIQAAPDYLLRSGT